ncbi:MAG: putative metal-dependent phosphoesterase TrpH, contains PHP domain [Chloroflexi bacterium AL-W]|nr:putative metal-dependent phosphoesterase TrpH, contains PHP domain [Chloroflexi bacterium AL-W]
MAAKRKTQMQWYRADLHLHTPASFDYLDKHISYLDILRQADAQGVEIIAFTDHNTVNGYVNLHREIDQLSYLESLGRATPDELQVLAEYRRLLDKILVLPGFEFTATFGFHILGIFSPDKPIREIEHLLLTLNLSMDVIQQGNSEVGASTDVLTAYRVISEAGGICIAAHVNTTHGVAMKGVNFGGQTRIAYTQDANLHALEATDMTHRGRSSTQRFFDGNKPEYPRRMRVIQGSDAHSLHAIQDERGRVIRWGVGDRTTEFLMGERSFAALLSTFQTNDFSRSRPYIPDHKPKDYVELAREEGDSTVQSFHDSMSRKGGHMWNILTDVCAFANTNGGTVYIGASADVKQKPIGITKPSRVIQELQEEIASNIAPTLTVEIDTLDTQGKTIIRVQVPFGKNRPYAIENTKIYVRDESDTTLAIRDEIVELVRQGFSFQEQPDGLPSAIDNLQALHVPFEQDVPATLDPVPAPVIDREKTQPPQGGVEIVGVETREDTRYYVMHDLRNGNLVKNVTQHSARRLWLYAIKQKETNPVRADKVTWRGEVGLWRVYKKNGTVRYDLVQKDNGIRVYYGATESGMHDKWSQFIVNEDDVPAE